MGGQFFSKSFRGVMSYKMEFAGQEGWLISAVILCLPPIILTVLVKLFLSESKELQPCEHLAEHSAKT
jgi:hypothetical protein